MPVYMIRAGDDGPVKIGVSGNIKKRVATLQGAHPRQLTLLRVVDGTFSTEKQFHSRFSHVRLAGEWFAFDPDMLTCDPQTLPLKVRRKQPYQARPPRPILPGVDHTAKIERMARSKGLSIAQVCRLANVNQATFQRWKGGATPQIDTYNRVLAVIESAPTDSQPHQE